MDPYATRVALIETGSPGLHIYSGVAMGRGVQWAWLHLQFKFAPWMILRVGRHRVRDFLRDADYSDYLGRLEG